MTPKAIPLARWLDPVRADYIVVAFNREKIWTLGDLRAHVVHLHERVRILPQREWALYFDDSYAFLVALLALLYSGKTPIIIGHKSDVASGYQKGWFNAVISDHPSILPGTEWVYLNPGELAMQEGTLPALKPNAHIVMFTSGSSSTPKKICKSIETMDKEVQLLASHWGLTLVHCSFLASVSHQHLYGFTFRLFLPLGLGCPFASEILRSPEQLAAYTQATGQPYAFISSPAFLSRVDACLTLPPCHFLLSAAGTLTWETANTAAAWLTTIPHEIYGSTETGVIAWRQHHQKNTPWQLFPSMRLVPQEAERYWLDSPLLPTTQPWLLTDRLDCLPDQRQFHLLGRIDRVVKIEEKRVSLTQLEHKLTDLAGIKEAIVLPLHHTKRQVLGAVLVLEETLQTTLNHPHQRYHTINTWKQQLARHVDPVCVPRYWRIVERFPTNDQGKQIYSELLELFHAPH